VPLTTTPQEDVAGSIAVMNRPQVQREIMTFSGRFRLDFSPEYLQAQTLNQLRHILLAAKLQQQKNY
jgi:hypothetical protein